MIQSPKFRDIEVLLKKTPDAKAVLSGSREYSIISGIVYFYQTNSGVLLAARVTGLPHSPGLCSANVFGFHIHNGSACTGNAEDPFSDAGSHYNPGKCEHPHHAGDLPPLFGNDGFAMMTVMTNRFTVAEVIGLPVLIHRNPDDFTTPPAGNSGQKIACGIIRRW